MYIVKCDTDKIIDSHKRNVTITLHDVTTEEWTHLRALACDASEVEVTEKSYMIRTAFFLIHGMMLNQFLYILTV